MGYSDMTDFAALAQAFVEATSPLVSYRTINIMDLDGIIIASTEKERIGSLHQGAREAVEKGAPVRITRENLHLYKGAKEGYNLPLFQNERIIGVVGLYGQEEEVLDAANLLRLYVIQYFERLELERKRRYEKEVREELLRLYLRGNPEDEENIIRLSGYISVYPRYPLLVIAIRKGNEGRTGEYESDFCAESLLNTKTEKYTGKNDLCGKIDDVCIILHSMKKRGGKDRLLLRLDELGGQIPGFYFAVSGEGRELSELPECYKEASGLLNCRRNHASYMNDPSDRSRYYIRKLILGNGERYIRELYRKLCEGTGEKQLEQLLYTAEIYFGEAASVNNAADKLGIHKNTVQYRMHQLYDLLFPEEEISLFERELFIRMLIEEHSEKLKSKGG